MGYTGLDPDQLRYLGAVAKALANEAFHWHETAGKIIWYHDVSEFGGQLLTWCREVDEEMGLLSKLAIDKAEAMELAAMGVPFVTTDPSILADLEASLNDDVGAPTMVGDEAIRQLVLSFPYIDLDGNGQLDAAELAEFIDKGQNASARAAVQYLLDNPVLNARILDTTHAYSAGNGGGDEIGITVDGMRSFLEQNALIAKLSNPNIFAEIASASGVADGKITQQDVEYVQQHPLEFSPYAIELARRFEQPDGLRVFGTWCSAAGSAPFAAPLESFLAGDNEVSFDDVIALTVNRQVFASDPEGARGFVNSLSPLSTWTDLSGNKRGIDISLSSNEGLRSLARSALIASPSLMDQVAVVANLPESTGGERNKLINHFYARLGYDMNLALNPTQLDPTDVTADGYSGFNWMMHGVSASFSVGPSIRGETSLGPIKATDFARQNAADGNQYIFGQMAFQYAAYLEAFPPGSTPNKAEIAAFFNSDHPMRGLGGPDRLFDNGQRQLRDGFVFYLSATQELDPVKRQQLTLGGNALLGIHEQAGIQHYLENIGDMIKGICLDDEIVTDEFIEEQVPGEDLKLDFSYDVPNAGDPKTNKTLGTPFYDMNLRPESLDVGSVTLDFGGGSGDVSLESTWGWSDAPKNFRTPPFPVDPRDWQAHPEPDLENPTDGSRAENWFDPADRMYTIATVFQQYHTDPRFMDGLKNILNTKISYNDLGYLDGVIA